MTQFAFRMSSFQYFLDHTEERESFFDDWKANYKFDYFELPNRDFLLVAYNIANDSLSVVMQDIVQITDCLTESLNVELMQITINSVACKPLK